MLDEFDDSIVPTREEAESAVDEMAGAIVYLSCPWYNGKGQCGGGCVTEPACQTGEPDGGWLAEIIDNFSVVYDYFHPADE